MKKRRTGGRRSTPRMKPWTATKLGYAAGIVGLILGLLAVASAIGKHSGLPDRVSHVEASTKSLSEGQIELGRRVDGLVSEMSGLRKDLEQTSRRSEVSMNDIVRQLAQISGTLNDVRDSARDNQREIVSVKEKAINAATLADEARSAAMKGK